MSQLAELRRKLGALTDELNTAEILADARKFEAKETEIADVTAQIARAQKALERSAALARPLAGGVADVRDVETESLSAVSPSLSGLSILSGQMRAALGEHVKAGMDDAVGLYRKASGWNAADTTKFRSFGEQLQAVARYYLGGRDNPDSRLMRAPTGAGEVDPTGGGFLVQTDFQAAIFMLAHDMGEILSRVNKIPISASANGIKINAVDETSRATGSRWGGVQSYWVNEGDTVAKSKPKFRRVEFDLHKLFSLMWVSDELLQDSTALTAIAGQAFSEEVMFMTEDAIFEGQGNGLPLGVMNAPALIQVAKQNGQISGSIVKENIDAMWSRCWSRSRKNAVWMINQLVEPYLFQLGQAVGTGGMPVFMPPSGVSGSPYATLYGRPVVLTEYNNAPGTAGDILLADWSQYTLVDKGGVQAATSMHIAFLTDESVFRITYRVDGKPMWVTSITPFKGNVNLSPFVALASR